MNPNQEIRTTVLTRTPSSQNIQLIMPPPPPYPFGFYRQPNQESSQQQQQQQSRPPMSLSLTPVTVTNHGGRISKCRKRKGVDDYAAEYADDFTGMTIQKDGKYVRVLICRYCHVAVGARSDRIREHLNSKRHHNLRDNAKAAGGPPRMDQVILKNGLFGLGITAVRPTAKATVTSASTSDLALAKGTEGAGYEYDELEYGARIRQIVKNIQASQPQPQLQQRRADENYNLLVDWTNHISNLRERYLHYWYNGLFLDVTLWSEGVQIGCHRLILSTGSAYFEKMLSTGTENPILFLTGIKLEPLKKILDFIYHGKCNVMKKDLAEFGNTAEKLAVRGLTNFGQNQGPGFNNNNAYGYGTVTIVDSDESGIASNEGSPSFGASTSDEVEDDDVVEINPVSYAMTQMRNQN